MKNICFYFQVHQPFRLKKYSFFNIGKEHYYYDDFLNESIVSRIATKCYLPTNELLLQLIEKHEGRFKVAFSISGTALDQFELYTPEVLESFKKLAATGCVEFLAETYSHSLISLHNKELFAKDVKKHSKRLKELLGVKKPKVFRNTELIYSDMIGKDVAEMGFKGILAEGVKQILDWQSPNFLYSNPIAPNLKMLLRNYKLSDDIAFRFSDKSWKNYPLDADKFAKLFDEETSNEDQIINLFMDYETFGEHQAEDSGIFSFLKHLPETLLQKEIQIVTPSEAIKNIDAIGTLSMHLPTSWADEERDVSAWIGNEMQKEAFAKLYELAPLMHKIRDKKLKKDWTYLQTSDSFYYMSTKWFSDGDVHAYFNPYPSPYDAFLNYMNILSDFSREIYQRKLHNQQEKDTIKQLKKELKQKEKQLKEYEKKLKAL